MEQREIYIYIYTERERQISNKQRQTEKEGERTNEYHHLVTPSQSLSMIWQA